MDVAGRPPQTPDERRVAQILSAIWRITRRYHLAVSADAVLRALGEGYWREIQNIEWAARVVIGRDIS